MGIDRRQLLGGMTAAASAVALSGAWSPRGLRWATAQGEAQTFELRGPLGPPGFYVYLPFTVPPGVNRIDGRVTDNGGAQTGLGLFDQRGTGYQTAGFRGVFGGELAQFSVAPDRASRSFVAGPIEPGEWTVLVPVFQPGPNPAAEVVVQITLHYGPQPPSLAPGPAPGVVNPARGWYRGDLHCHTPESSDAFNSGTAMTPAQWAAECRRVGLDFASMTDHNVVSQNLALVDDMAAAGGGVLLIGGEEMTNWFHGHATVTGIEPGEWLDWRQRPEGVPLQMGEGRITEFVATAREMGAFTAAAHPLGPSVGLPWMFLAEGTVDPAAFPDGFEVWTGDFQPDDAASLQTLDTLWLAGRRIAAVGGSDLHGTVNDLQPAGAGTPTTLVHAEELSPAGIVAGARAGRCTVSRDPRGGELYLTATGPGGQRTYTGGEIAGGPLDTVDVEVLVRRGSLLADDSTVRLVLLRDGVPISTTPITAQEQTVGLTVPVGLGGYVRAELRGAPFLDTGSPVGSRLDMEAFTNPIWLSRGGDGVDEEAPPPDPLPRRLDEHRAALDPGVVGR
ncbi:CehA/McbA family metallohydrolase [soil metagenome]